MPLTEFATAVALVEYTTKAISIVTGFVSNIWDDVVGFFDKGTPLEAYKRIVPRTYHPDLRLGILTSPATLDDAAFAEQRLSGLHPLMVTAITWAKVAQVYGVAEAIAAAVTMVATTAGAAELEPTTAQYYECNWSQYFAPAAAQLKTSKYAYGCRALFVAVPQASQAVKLMPVAIIVGEQVVTVDTANPPLWTVAKMFAQIADLHVHEMRSHLFGGHFYQEPFVLAWGRHLQGQTTALTWCSRPTSQPAQQQLPRLQVSDCAGILCRQAFCCQAPNLAGPGARGGQGLRL